MKRGRNQRRRQGVNPNRALDSNGPDVRIRGTANQIYDKYQALARDASSSGDRIKAESYLQHAEHYFRLIRATQQANQQQPAQQESDSEQPAVGEDDQPELASENGRDGGRSRDGRRERPQRGNGMAADARSGDDEAGERERKPAAESRAETTDEEEERKPRRRRATRKKAVKRGDDDEAVSADQEEEEPAPAAAAE